jgi:predicted DNA-binding transcriptional regulator AlpA
MTNTPDDTMPDDVRRAIDDIARLGLAMAEAAKHQAKKHPSPSGLYPVTVLMSADGSVAGVDGHPIVTFPPVTVAKVDHVGVHFTHPNQHVSPGNLASLADVHVATIWRAVSEGALPKPTKLSSRRVGFPLQDVQAWLAGRKVG